MSNQVHVQRVSSIDDFEEVEDEEDDDEVFETMDNTADKIEDKLFLGSFLAEQNIEALQLQGITHVLQVAEDVEPSHPEMLTYMTIHLTDEPGSNLITHFHDCIKFIQDAHDQGGGVLVHCMAGVSRSATVVIAFLMQKYSIGYSAAFKRVHAVRPWIMPNSGFQRQLVTFEEQGYVLAAASVK